MPIGIEVSFFHIAVQLRIGAYEMQRQRIFSLRKILPEYLQVWRFFRKYEVVCRMNHTQYLCNAKRERQRREAAMKEAIYERRVHKKKRPLSGSPSEVLLRTIIFLRVDT